MKAFRASLDTLGAFQSELGGVPLNVDVNTNTVTKENAGATDANLWFILGHTYYYLRTKDLVFLQQHLPNIERALLWLRYQDMNDCGLLEVPEAGDWMDLFANRYNILYDNVLWVAVWRAMGLIREACGGDGSAARREAENVAERINLLMWIDRCWYAAHFAERLAKLKSMHLEWYMLYHNVGSISSRPFYLPYVAFREYGDWLDSLGNLLAILVGLSDNDRSRPDPALYVPGWWCATVSDKSDLSADPTRTQGLARVLPQPQPQSAQSVPQRRYLALHRRLPCRGTGSRTATRRSRGVAAIPGQCECVGRGATLGVQRVDARRDRQADGLCLPGMVGFDVCVCL